MPHPVSPYDRDESFLEKHLGLAIFMSVGLHVLIGWIFLLVLPNVLEARRAQALDYITVQLLGDLAPPAPALPANTPVDPKASGPEVVERPKSTNQQTQTTPKATSVPPVEEGVIGLKKPEAEKPPEIKKKDPPKTKVSVPKKVEPAKPKKNTLDDEIDNAMKQVAARVQSREQNPPDSNMGNRDLDKGQGQGDSGQSGGRTSGAQVDPRKAAYYLHIRDIVVSNWVTPVGYSANSNLDFRLVIQPNGSLSRIEQVRSSGNPDLDVSLQRAINMSNPLPPLPEVFEGQAETVILRFNPDDVRRLHQG